jgi:tRNA dimethylallyltransferase
VPPNPGLRAALQLRAETDGPESLHAELAAGDPRAAARIDLRNVRRVIRALEVRAFTEQEPATNRQAHLDQNTLAIGLTMPREALYARIDARVDRMMEAGWLREVEGLLERGYETSLTSMSSIGYLELAEHLGGGADLADTVQRIKHRTHRLARNQYVWLRRARWLEWFEADEAGVTKAMDRVGEWRGGMP